MIDAVAFAEGVQGWMLRPELEWLAATARAQQPGCRWVEVGVWMGRSWSCVALSLPKNSRLVGVDTFDGGTTTDDNELARILADKGSVEEDFQRTQLAVTALRPDLHLPIMKHLSTVAARMVGDPGFDVVFIDADHHTAAVMADIKAWLPTLKHGGLLCGHDGNDPRVAAAVASFGWPVEWVEGTSLWAYRVP